MPADRASVPSCSAIPTHKRRDIPLPAEDSERSGLRLVLILVASFMVVLDFTIVNIALPSIEHVGAALLPAVADSVHGVSGDRAAMLAATAVALAATAVSWQAARRARAEAVTGSA